MLSKSSSYAIRAVLFLSKNASEDVKFSPKEIAEKINIPAPFLAKTLQELTKRDLVTSKKGRNGGFYLTADNTSNSLLAIVDAIDGLEKFESCSLGLPVCDGKNPCPLHHIIALFKSHLVDELSKKTIKDFTLEIDQGKTHLF